MANGMCALCGTEGPLTRGWCKTHYMRWYRTGDPGGPELQREKHTDRLGVGSQPAYHSWFSARQRCTDPEHPQWPNYGGRGIAMCERWLGSFDAFYADMGDSAPGLSLDRIDNDGNYEPGNCKWSTRSEQQKNKRRRTLCSKGLHSLLDPANIYVTPSTGKKRCRQCMLDLAARRVR